jgi:hypothetical protein
MKYEGVAVTCNRLIYLEKERKEKAKEQSR